MAIEKAALRVTELDFLSIKENLKTFLRSQTEFQDFDFDPKSTLHYIFTVAKALGH